MFGPGTADPHVVPPARRERVSRGANIVIVGGVVSGTWELRDDEVTIDWFAESGSRPGDRLDEEVARLASILDRPLRAAIHTA